MANFNTVLDLYDQFKRDATSELEKYYKLFEYHNAIDEDFYVVLVPTEESEKQLLDWYDTNKTPYSQLNQIAAEDVVIYMVTSSDIDYRLKDGCLWVEC